MTVVSNLDTRGHLFTATEIRAAMAGLCDPSILRVADERKSFKNCVMLWVHVKDCKRKTCVKVFTNSRPTLHITGVKSTEMLNTAVDTVCTLLEQALQRGTLTVTPRVTRIVMVNYRLVLPGRVCLAALVDELVKWNVLCIFDPNAYAAVRVKLRLQSNPDMKLASVMIFDSGKVIAIIPESNDRDGALTEVQQFLQKVCEHWQRVALV